ncbi:MAG: class I mannose-6-phosphate isomerase [Chloroflexi bacterium]|nr:class I mannose-6-phosphate isomerase [Chloroflexota bacterium]
MTTYLPPLITERKLVEPIWGGTRLAAWLNLPEPRPARLGESWQVYDTNRVMGGPFAGTTLGELARAYGAALVGSRTVARYGADLPLLAKFIDAADRLSIQVHPDDAYAHSVEAHTGFHGKTEAWYIIDAVPGASVTYGLKRPGTRAEFAAAVAAGTVEELMASLPVAPGDVVFVPAGTLHAINAGIVLFEIQQKSDLTYRVYDYGRRDAKTGQPRELHLERALAVSRFGPAPDGVVQPLALAAGRDLLVACPSFALERWQVAGQVRLSVDPGSFEILTVLAGAGSLTPDSPGSERCALQRGISVVLPASLGACSLDGELTVLRAYVPDLDGLTAAARAAGHGDPRIADVIRAAAAP